MDQAAAGRPTAQGSDSDTRELQNRLDSVSGQVKRLQAGHDKMEYASCRAASQRDVWPDVRDQEAKGSKGKDSKSKAGKGGRFQQDQTDKQGGGGGGGGKSRSRYRSDGW